MDQPNGAALDSFHNILVCDSRNHRIQLLNDEGKVDRSLLTKADGLKLPMAIKTDPSGFLLVAEYQGNIKTFRYMEAAVDLLPAGKFITTISASDAAPELVTISCADTQSTNSPAKVSTHDNTVDAEDINSGKEPNDNDVKPLNGCLVQDVATRPKNISENNELLSSETARSDLNTVNCTTMSESVL